MADPTGLEPVFLPREGQLPNPISRWVRFRATARSRSHLHGFYGLQLLAFAYQI